MGRAEERTNYILDRLAREGEVSVAQLASDLGVSPVTVRASLKSLDEQGYLVRVPDDRDARGILFKLTPQGMLCVQDVADDLYAVLVSMFGEAVEERAVQRALKHLLELEDAALDELGELSW